MAEKTMAQLREELKNAAAKGDMDAILSLSKEVAKLDAADKAERAKLVEGLRTGIVEGIKTAIRPVLEKFADDKLEGLGGVVRITYQPSNSQLLTVAIASTAPAKVSSATGNGYGKPGKLRGIYGMSLGEMFDKVATADEQSEYATKEGNSAQYAYKNRIVQAAIAAGVFKPSA